MFGFKRRRARKFADSLVVDSPPPIVARVSPPGDTSWLLDSIAPSERPHPRDWTPTDHRSHRRAQVDAALLFLTKRVTAEEWLSDARDSVRCAVNILMAPPGSSASLRLDGRI